MGKITYQLKFCSDFSSSTAPEKNILKTSLLNVTPEVADPTVQGDFAFVCVLCVLVSLSLF